MVEKTHNRAKERRKEILVKRKERLEKEKQWKHELQLIRLWKSRQNIMEYFKLLIIRLLKNTIKDLIFLNGNIAWTES